MHSQRLLPALRGATTGSLALLLLIAPLCAAAAGTSNRAELEKQLDAARAQLDESAREVAELSRELYGEPGEAMHFMHGGPRGSMLGINIGGPARDEGVEVMGVSPGGPAEQAGLKAGDVVVAVDGKTLRRSGERSASAQLVEYMRGVEPGRSVKVDYQRGSERRSASVGTAPAEPVIVRMLRDRLAGGPGEFPALPGLEALLGPAPAFGSLELVGLTPKLGQYFGTDTGLLVVRAPANKGLPLEEGDVLQTIDGRTPDSPGHAFRILRSYQPGEKVKLAVLRQRKSLVLDATIPAADTASRHGAGSQAPSPPRPPAPPNDAGPA